MKSEAMKKFEDWSAANGTHLDRHLSVLSRQGEVFKEYVEILKTYPANSQEFYDGIMSLHKSIEGLADEMVEVNFSFADDCEEFRKVLDALKQEIMEYYEDKK